MNLTSPYKNKGSSLAINSCTTCLLTKEFDLRFRLIDELNTPMKAIPYKTLPTGTENESSHISDSKTDADGKTVIVSSDSGEKIDMYIVWAKININKNWIKW